ncbi:MAG: macro domain-containing protein [Methylococcaceae bacterium]|nr:macro domain-containing protein [Methylococcaceae bacterium]
MIHQVSGDILLSKAQAIAHGVAPNDPFSSGLAHSLRESWPSMYKDFRHYCQTSHPKSGTLWMWSGAQSTRIINLFTQEAAYGHGEKPGKATLEHVNHSLRELHKLIDTEKFSSVALPRLATGVGGLDWKDVSPLIEKHLGDLTIPIYIYTTFHKDVAANEPA